MITWQRARKTEWESGDKLVVLTRERSITVDRQVHVQLFIASLDVIWAQDYAVSPSRYHVFMDGCWALASLLGVMR